LRQAVDDSLSRAELGQLVEGLLASYVNDNVDASLVLDRSVSASMPCNGGISRLFVRVSC
jgi:hypothetical protein